MGIKDIAIAKRNEYQKIDGEYQKLLTANQSKIIDAEVELKTIEDFQGNCHKHRRTWSEAADYGHPSG